VTAYTDAIRDLCAQLDIGRVAVVGVSGGGPTAATMAARHADLVRRLIPISAVGWLPYPSRPMRIGSRIVFAGATEPVTWAATHALARWTPGLCLRLMMSSLSTLPVRQALVALTRQDRDLLLALFASMRPGHGFVNDLRRRAQRPQRHHRHIYLYPRRPV
jgi:pimeloyl-ACP methyl ester carboxylesterase